VGILHPNAPLLRELQCQGVFLERSREERCCVAELQRCVCRVVSSFSLYPVPARDVTMQLCHTLL